MLIFVFIIALIVIYFSKFNFETYVPLQYKNDFYVWRSNIHGQGVFANIDIHKERYLFDGIIIKKDNSKEIPFLASKVNHCEIANTYLKFNQVKNIFEFWSKSNIKLDEELKLNYQFTPSFIQKNKSFWKC